MSYGDEGAAIGYSTARARDWPSVRQFNVFLENRLAVGRLVVVDATNVESGARRALLARAAAAQLPAVAIVLAIPATIVVARNAGRTGRIVDQETAAAVLATFTGLLIKLIGEPLAASLLRQAWPDGFSDARAEETGA